MQTADRCIGSVHINHPSEIKGGSSVMVRNLVKNGCINDVMNNASLSSYDVICSLARILCVVWRKICSHVQTEEEGAVA